MQDRTIHLTGPAFSIPLYALDHCAPSTYSQRALIFAQPARISYEEVAEVLQNGIQATINQIPFLAGSWELVEVDGQKSRHAMVAGNCILKFKDLSEQLDFHSLKSAAFSQHLLDANLLSPTEMAAARKPGPVMFVQANFIKGGLILVVSIHHIAADGRAITTIINKIAASCRDVSNGQQTVSLSDGALDRSPLKHGRAEGGNIEKHPAYIISEGGRFVPPPQRSGVAIVSETFTIPVDKQKLLKNATSQLQQHANLPFEPPSYVTTHDAICALIWRTVMAARLQAGIIMESDSVAIYHPIDVRSIVRPALPPDFIGNGWLNVLPDIQLRHLLADDGLAVAANCLRSALNGIDDDAVRDFISVVDAQVDVSHVQFRIFATITTTGLFTTSYRKFVHDSDWGSVIGKLECFRLPNNSFLNGCAVIMPELKDGSTEFALMLDSDVMVLVKKDPLWQRYVLKGMPDLDGLV